MDENLILLTQGLPPEAPEFDSIIHRCGAMKRLVAKARKVAIFDVPVLILGESGTGKEILARAIHASSLRRNDPFVAVNCGAVPLELFEAEFFGHEKGAFTGAVSTREGYLEKANSGTLFLDEIGDLPLSAQVKLLRAIQEGTIQKIGSTKTIKIDLRIMTATNRNLIQDVSNGLFREDLFHRLAVAVLQIPPLRERKGDISLLVDHVITDINRKCSQIPGWKHKIISVGARNLLLQHNWPGNIRELINTLSRAAIWTGSEAIQAEDIQESLLPMWKTVNREENFLNRDMDNGFNLLNLLSQISRHYLKRALSEANGNKTLAAKLIGLPNYQTFTNWIKKYNIDL
jgi:transcriptional regulator with PAS, ATPase and Fis domain